MATLNERIRSGQGPERAVDRNRSAGAREAAINRRRANETSTERALREAISAGDRVSDREAAEIDRDQPQSRQDAIQRNEDEKRARAKETVDIGLGTEIAERGLGATLFNHALGLVPGFDVQAKNFANVTRLDGTPIAAPSVTDFSGVRAVGDVVGFATGVPALGDIADTAASGFGVDTSIDLDGSAISSKVGSSDIGSVTGGNRGSDGGGASCLRGARPITLLIPKPPAQGAATGGFNASPAIDRVTRGEFQTPEQAFGPSLAGQHFVYNPDTGRLEPVSQSP